MRRRDLAHKRELRQDLPLALADLANGRGERTGPRVTLHRAARLGWRRRVRWRVM